MTSFARILRALVGVAGLSVKDAYDQIRNSGGSTHSAGLNRQARIAKKPFVPLVHTRADYCEAASLAHQKRARKSAKRLLTRPLS